MDGKESAEDCGASVHWIGDETYSQEHWSGDCRGIWAKHDWESLRLRRAGYWYMPISSLLSATLVLAWYHHLKAMLSGLDCYPSFSSGRESRTVY